MSGRRDKTDDQLATGRDAVASLEAEVDALKAIGSPASAEENFAHNVRRLREKQGLSQEALASMMSARGYPFHQATIYKIEAGSRRVQIGEAAALATALSAHVEAMTLPPEDQEPIEAIRAEIASFSRKQHALTEAVRVYVDAAQALSWVLSDDKGPYDSSAFEQFDQEKVEYWRNQANRSAGEVADNAAQFHLLYQRAEYEAEKMVFESSDDELGDPGKQSGGSDD